MKYFFAMIVLFSCSNNVSNNKCDYIPITYELLENIKNYRVDKIRSMMAEIDDEFWSKGSSAENIIKNTKLYLDSVANYKKLDNEIFFNYDEPINYAVVRIYLSSKKLDIKNIFEVRFLHPESPFKCKINSFDFVRLGTSNKIDISPQVNNVSQ